MDKHSYKILKKIYSSNFVPFDQLLALIGCSRDNYRSNSEFEMLSGYIQIGFVCPDGEDGDRVTVFSLTPEGRAAVEDRRSFIFGEIRAWGTLAIALAAFIKSFFY